MRGGLLVLALLLLGTAYSADTPPPGPLPSDAIPRDCLQWRRTLTREVRFYWGWGQPVSPFAAQIQQESWCRSAARSAFASGLGQQTPPTTKWLQEIYPADLGNAGQPVDPALNPHWSIRALVLYDQRLWKEFVVPNGDNRYAFMYAAYNGGSGNLRKEIRHCAGDCDPTLWFDHVERVCLRAQWACIENREYPRKILYRWRPLYRGWD